VGLAAGRYDHAEALKRRANEFLDLPSDEANGFELTRFLAAIKAGDVA
jgi:hypothetical protein